MEISAGNFGHYWTKIGVGAQMRDWGLETRDSGLSQPWAGADIFPNALTVFGWAREKGPSEENVGKDVVGGWH